MSISLPSLNSDQQQHCEAVKAEVNRIIQAKGHLSFFDYMQLVLYAPSLGYYQAGSKKFGAAGDFVTAPEISPLFGYAIAQQCLDALQYIPNGSILEFGAGTGALARDVLLNLQKEKCLPERYCIIEVSADLVERQRDTLSSHPELLERVEWLSALPDEFVGVVLANEVLDAMPVELFCWYESELHRALVGCVDHKWQLLWQTQKKDWLPSHVQRYFEAWPQPYMSEFNPMLRPWLKELSGCLQQGVVLLVDYGFSADEYYHADRQQGTLMCHYQHHAHSDPLIYPGLQDVTAHVDFSAVAHAAADVGFSVAGYSSQANFLLACDILNATAAKTEKQSLKESQQLQTLLMPAEMGELFKVIALTRQHDAPLRGFVDNDHRYRL